MEWLFKKEEYIPLKDKDKFIDKSIFSFLKLISLIRRTNRYAKGFIYRLNPAFKFGFSFLLIIFLSLSSGLLYPICILAYSMLLLSFLEYDELKHIIPVSIIFPAFTFIMLIPSIISGNVYNSIVLVIKVASTIILINSISFSTKYSHMTRTLKVFFIPDIFIFIFDITLKYIFILGDYALSMLYALKLRSVGKNSGKYISLSRIMGTLFLKSKEMGDEMYSAMECRCYTGEYSASMLKFKISYKDYLFATVNIILYISYFLIGRRI